ncbi:hypothetical protein ADL12_08885 [Streptomyces regalis]|uniref:Uncharacterized protein n=1 Tax=Streptomyces regalis TaxID=68262 RepID=A0A0X3VDR6_9ACTN|nr:hypothetical protein ADL12_08885 [Streptomyces regalis]
MRGVDDEGGAGVGQHVFDPRRWIGGVHGQVGGPCLEHAQDRHHQFHAAWQDEGHHVLGPDTPGGQRVREPVGPRVQLPVRQGGVVCHQRDHVGSGSHLGLEQHRYGSGGSPGRGGVTRPEQTPPLIDRQHIQHADR